MVELLAGHAVEHVFGLCGDTSLPFYDALACMDHGMQHILVRDERHAAYMADAYARVTGRPGICEGPSGGGATYILPGLIEANDSSVPILAITTDIATSSAGRYPLTDLDQESLFKPVTKWNGVIPSGDLLPRMVRRAFREMTTGRPGSVHLGLPFDVQKAPVADDDVWAASDCNTFPAHPAAPDEADVEAVFSFLARSQRPVIVCGGGVVLAGATDELAALAETLDIPVCTTVSGQGSLSDRHPNAVGVVGSNGGQPATRAVVDESDCVFFVGCRAGSVTTERWRSPGPDTIILHLDNDPSVIGACYSTSASMVCDAHPGLAALARLAVDASPRIEPKGGMVRTKQAKKAKWAMFQRLSRSNDSPVLPERVIAELQLCLPDDAIICADPGTPCPYVSAWYQWPKAGRHFISNRAHGALGYAIGASIGAQVGRPNATVLSLTGDGSFAMSVGELETIRRLDLPITILVFSNASFGWIKAGQKAGFGSRYFSVDFSRTDHAAVASAYGIKSWRVEDPRELASCLKKAIALDGPAVVDIIAQPLHEAAAPVSEWIA